MGTGIARIRNEVADRAVSNGQPRLKASRCWFVHEQGTNVIMTDWSLLAPVFLADDRMTGAAPSSRAKQRCAAKVP
jgi:hypothetical protein